MAVYLNPDVSAVRALWTRSGAQTTPVVAGQLAAFADALRAARSCGQRSASVLVWNWSHGDADELSPDGSLSERDARLIVARDHGFASWQLVNGRCDPSFERAVDAVVMGRLGELHRLLTDQPDLVTRRSAYGHRATLLHYTAANGVEIRRQVGPRNADRIAALLLAEGADVAAELNAYGGSFDALAMLASSGHRADAGVVRRGSSACSRTIEGDRRVGRLRSTRSLGRGPREAWATDRYVASSTPRYPASTPGGVLESSRRPPRHPRPPAAPQPGLSE